VKLSSGNRSFYSSVFRPSVAVIYTAVLYTSFIQSISAKENTSVLKWSFETNGAFYSTPAIGSDDELYFGAVDGHVYALDSNENLMWGSRTAKYVTASQSLIKMAPFILVPQTISFLPYKTMALKNGVMEALGRSFPSQQ
jgi:outer membrane protein assembly factor BamB